MKGDRFAVIPKPSVSVADNSLRKGSRNRSVLCEYIE